MKQACGVSIENSVEIREICDKYYREVHSLINHELGYSDCDFYSLSKRLNLMKKQGNYYIFCAFVDNNLVGFVGTVQEIAFELDRDYLRIIGIAVSKSFQCNGVGTLLLKYIESFAKEKGFSVVALNSGLQRFDAHKFYEKNGFVKKSYGFTKTVF